MAVLGDWRFLRRQGVCQVLAPGGVTVAASAGSPDAGLVGADALGVPEAPVPAGMRSHTLRCRFRSDGFFRAEPGAHFAIGLTGAWRKTNPHGTSWNGLLAGRGVIVGNVSGAPNGCPRWPVVQIESFRTHGNALYVDSGSIRLEDENWYDLTLTSHLDGRIDYVLSDGAGLRLSHAHVIDATDEVPSGLGGWWITHVFAGSDAQAAWSFDIADLDVVWR
jgi:hypothetical protein